MAKEMKAVIRAEVDPSGVVRGVAAVNRELQKVSRSAGTTALASTFQMAQMGFHTLQTAFMAIDRRMQEIAKMSTRFSPEALRAGAETQYASIQQEMELGRSLGIGVAGMERVKQRAIAEETARLKAMGPEQMVAGESFKSDAISAWNRLLELPGNIAANPIPNFVQDDVSRFWTGTSASELAGGVGSARGMQYDPQLEELKRQTQLLKGTE